MSEPITDRAEAVRVLGALPVPLGSEPRNEEERLRMEVVRLQDLLATAMKDVARASRARDELREQVSEPYGCAHCGVAKSAHGRRWWTGVGVHSWSAPDQGQIAERMRARRTVRVASEVSRLRARVAELEAERHVTNEALDDALQSLREKDRGEGVGQKPDPRGCQACGSLPEAWCPDCAACERGCFGGFEGNACSHSNPRWERPAADEAHDPFGLHHTYRVGRDLPEGGGR